METKELMNEAVDHATTNLDIFNDKIKNGKKVTLADTVDLMNSSDYKERFIAEYLQTKIRYNSLHKMIIKYDAGTLDFDITTPIITLKNQKNFMGQYLNQLEIRAEIEGIVLPLV